MTTTSTSTTSVTQSATSQLIASLGSGSGIDMAAFATQLSTAQFAARIDRLSTKSETLDRQISAASTLRSMMLSLSTSLGDRVRAGDLSPQPQIANGAVAKGSLSGTTQPKGSFSLEVTQLAAAQSVASRAYTASTDLVGSGSLKLRFGTIASGSFTEDPAHAAVDITINAGATLSDVATAINAKNAGVTAYIANSVDGPKLVLKGTEGEKNAFVLEATEASGDPGLANLAWAPGSTSGTLLTSAANANLKVDGLPISSATNTVTDAIPGVTLALTGTNTGAPTTVNFSSPGASISTAMQDLTAALNELVAELNKEIDPKSGDLARDSGARTLQRSLSSLAGTVIMPDAAEGAPRTLADLGLKTQRDGTFLFDATVLTATLTKDAAGAAAMFTNGINGVYAAIDNIYRKTTVVSDPGSLAGAITRYQAQKTQVTEDQADIATKQEALRARLLSQLSVSESRVAASKSTLTFIQNQIDAWNASSN